MGRCRSVGFLKSFLSCASQLSEASILVFFDFSHASEPLSTEAEGRWVVASAELQALFSVLGALIHIWKPQNADGWTCVFTVVGGNVCFTVPLHGWKFNHMWETFHDFFFFVPPLWKDVWDQTKVLVDMSLQVLTSGLGPLIDNRRFTGSSTF